MAEKFLLVGTKAQLPATREANKLYWVSDTRELYKGNDLYTEAVRVVAALPTTPATGVLYILPTGEVQSWTGTSWTVVAKPYVTTGTLDNTNTENEVPTAKVVYDSIVEAITEATSGGDVVNNITSTKAGIITVTKGVDEQGKDITSDVNIKGVIVNPEFDATTRTITLPYADGTDSLVITLGKDIFIDPTKTNGYNAETGNLEIWLNDGGTNDDGSEKEATKITIPASSLIDVYTGGTTSTAIVSVSTESNVITADVRISSVTGNRLSVVTSSSIAAENGLMVDVSDLATSAELSTATSSISALAGRMDSAETAITTLNGDSTTVGSVDYKIDQSTSSINSALTGLDTRLDTIEGDENTTGSVLNAIKVSKAYTDAALEWGTFTEETTPTDETPAEETGV